MNKNKVIGVMGGAMIGSDPYNPRCWSGSSKYFFTSCKEKDILHRAFGVKLKRGEKYRALIRNIALTKNKMRQKYYLDTSVYNLITNKIIDELTTEDLDHTILQIGAHYKIAERYNGKARCFSYHDGNLAQLMKSQFFKELSLSANIVDRAFEYERNACKSLNKILTMSEYLRNSFIDDYGIDPEKVRMIGCGINIENIPDEFEKDYSLQNILFIGVDFERKGGFVLLEAFKVIKDRFPNALLHIVGPRKLTIPGRLRKGTRYYGYLSKYDYEQNKIIDTLYRKASLFVLPSLYEPFGIAPLEAMLSKIPCVLTNDWAFTEMVTPGKTGELVQCNQVENLIEVITSLINDAAKLEKMGKESRRIVLGKYLWKHVAERLEKELND